MKLLEHFYPTAARVNTMLADRRYPPVCYPERSEGSAFPHVQENHPLAFSEGDAEARRNNRIELERRRIVIELALLRREVGLEIRYVSHRRAAIARSG